MKDYKSLYENLNAEFKRYQVFVEDRLQKLKQSNKELERKLSIFVNIVEVSKYINSYISDSNLLAMINDMIVGVLGVSYSTIHLIEDGVLVPKVTNIGNLDSTKIHYTLEELETKEPFIKNTSKGLFVNSENRDNINSLVAVPIHLKEKLIGYIIVEHIYYTFFEDEDVKFVSYIAHQVAIAIENSALYKRIQDAADKDSLLGIYNRRYFYEKANKVISKCEGEFFAVVMCDIDDFKTINDTYGHQIGDLALKSTVSIMKENLEEEDILARYGGEELVMLIKSCSDEKGTIEKIEKIRQLIEEEILSTEDGKPFNITVSFGVSFPMQLEDKKLFMDRIIKVADDKLYVAKRTGKNKVEY